MATLFSQLNAMENNNNKRHFDKNQTNIENNNSANKKSRTTRIHLLDLPNEMLLHITCQSIENVINDSSSIFTAVSNAFECIYNIILTNRDLYKFKYDLIKHTQLYLKNKFIVDDNNNFENLFKLLEISHDVNELLIAKAIINGIDYNAYYEYPPKSLFHNMVKQNYKKAIKLTKFYDNINFINNNNFNNKLITDNIIDPLVRHPEIKNYLEQALETNTNNLQIYLDSLACYFKNSDYINHIKTQLGIPLLIEAVIKDNINAVKILLENHADINIIYKHTTLGTALHAAIARNNITMLKYLLEKGAKADVQDIYNNTPLMIACRLYIKKDIIQDLVKNTKNIDLQNNHGNTALMYATDIGLINTVRLFIKQGANVNIQNNHNNNALILATIKNYQNIVQLLIQANANINMKDKNGRTALIWAAHRGHTEIARLLIDAGANINHQESNGNNALTWAAYQGYKDIVKLLIENKANIDLQCKYGNTALIYAARNGHKEIVELLIENGANVNIENNDKCIALAAALCNYRQHFSNYNKKIIKMLIAKSKNINKKDSQGNAILIYATRLCNSKIIKLFIEAGADINDKGDQEDSILILAAENGHTEIVELLIKKGVDINHKDYQGDNALILAAKKGYIDIIKLLIQADANVNHANNQGNTALILAAKKGYTNIVELLINAKASVNHKNNQGNTAIMLAEKKKHMNIVQLLTKAGVVSQKDFTNRTSALVL